MRQLVVFLGASIGKVEDLSLFWRGCSIESVHDPQTKGSSALQNV